MKDRDSNIDTDTTIIVAISSESIRILNGMMRRTAPNRGFTLGPGKSFSLGLNAPTSDI